MNSSPHNVIDDDSPFAYTETLLVIPDAFGYQVPPRATARGYSAEDLKRQQIWEGAVQVRAVGAKASVELVSRDGALFAACPLHMSKTVFGESVERTIDSSRYFVLRVMNKEGRIAYIGIGLRERSQAFDLVATLTDWQERRNREAEAAEMQKNTDVDTMLAVPMKDLTLKAPIRINIKGKTDVKGTTTTTTAQDNDLLNPFAQAVDVDSMPGSSSSSSSVVDGGSNSSGSMAMLAPPPPSTRTRAVRKT